MKKLPIYIVIISAAFFLDVWILSACAAALCGQSVDYYLLHPISVGAKYLLAVLGLYTISNPATYNSWVMLNITLIAIGGIGTMYYFTKANPRFSSNLLGSAAWLRLREAKKVFRFSLSPGILFGKHAGLPVVLPPDAGGNRNVAVFGPPGSMKSRAYVRNNMFQAVTSGWSVIVTDPKGELTRDFKSFFEDQGYNTRVFNLVDMAHSDRWNPLSEVHTDIDAQMFCEIVIANTSVPGKKGGDPFWDRAETNLLKALVLYVVNELPSEQRNIGSLYTILASGDSKYLDTIFGILPHSHPAKMPFNIYCETAPQVRSGVIIGLGTRLQVFQNQQVRNLTETSDIGLELPGQEKSAYFCIVSDMDHTFDFLASLYFSFLFINLTRSADRHGGELKIPTNFLLDEFCNIGQIPDFHKKISTMRGRGIACSVIFQSISQLMGFYPDNDWETILADCDSWLILGVKDVTTAEYVSKHLGVGTIQVEALTKKRSVIIDLGSSRTQAQKRNLLNPDEITRMPKNQAILSAFGLKPLKVEKMDFTKHPMSKHLKPIPINQFRPAWSFPNDEDATQKYIAEIMAETAEEARNAAVVVNVVDHQAEDVTENPINKDFDVEIADEECGIFPPEIEPEQKTDKKERRGDHFWG